jgi:hypothetical protein
MLPETSESPSSFDHLERIEASVNAVLQQIDRVNLMLAGSQSVASAAEGGAHFQNLPLPWLHNIPSAAWTDTDHDGIPDALDFFFGQGAHPGADFPFHH